MSLIRLDNASLRLGRKDIFKSLNFAIQTGDRIGLIGPNGSGKSSLLKLLSKTYVPDSGVLEEQSGLKLAYLPQDFEFPEPVALIDLMLNAIPDRALIESAIETITAQLGTTNDEDTIMRLSEELAEAHERHAAIEQRFPEHEALTILSGLGFKEEERTKNVQEFSGGWKMRCLLASLLFQKPDVLLLDEPTNHLDMKSVVWLGKFLGTFSGSYMLTCHDKDFLNEAVTSIVSFDPEGVGQYKGNYKQYIKQRAESAEIRASQAKNIQKRREDILKFVEKNRAKASKAKAAQSRLKELEKLDSIPVFIDKTRNLSFRFKSCARSGDIPLKTNQLCHAYGEKKVLNDVSLEIKRGQHIGIVGDNGAGKTTLLRILSGELVLQRGDIISGHKAKTGYYAQHHAETLPQEVSIIDFLSHVDPSANQTRLRTILGTFLFDSDAVDKHIKVLSGGERARIALASLMLKEHNLLLMDEPTNHLDIESTDAVAEALTAYEGSLVFVSHNQSFLRKLATTLWIVGDGTVLEYPGTFDEYRDHLKNMAITRSEDENTNNATRGKSGKNKRKKGKQVNSTKSDAQSPHQNSAGSRADDKASNKAQRKRARQIERIEATIAELESEQTALSKRLEDPTVYEDDAKRNALLTEYQTLSDKLAAANETWESLA